MLKILLWFVSREKNFALNAINILEGQNFGVEIVGKAAGEDLSGFDKSADVILVVGAKYFGMNRIAQAARQLKLPEEKLLGDWIVCLPGFTLEKYRRLQRSRLSIFAQNCFGGFISHALGLSFCSPFVNLSLRERDFICFLHEPHTYMDKNLIFSGKDPKGGYPLADLGDINLRLVHYRDFDEAISKWNERKRRINWWNLFVTMHTEREEILQEFDALPYGKKVCFVPFKSDLDSAWYINPEIDFDRAEAGFYNVVSNFARGKYFYYDPFDMLLYGKKTQLIDM